MTYKWPNSSFFNFQENANQENRRQYSCIILFNWQIGTKDLTKKKINVEPSFFTSWTITSVNAHGRTCKKTKVYIYLYNSLYENVFENGCIYIYIFVSRFMFGQKKKKRQRQKVFLILILTSFFLFSKNVLSQFQVILSWSARKSKDYIL